ncbi:hypothetical protein WJX72_008906 [[Myrmecia] bisecta]|uniref:Uncharacterized protein n=1 Tax=[Myrmecia] bisecta TaxID=41462 RepID=A0AAW1R8K2_9CHLO
MDADLRSSRRRAAAGRKPRGRSAGAKPAEQPALKVKAQQAKRKRGAPEASGAEATEETEEAEEEVDLSKQIKTDIKLIGTIPKPPGNCCYSIYWQQVLKVASPEERDKFNKGTCPKCLGLCMCRKCMRVPSSAPTRPQLHFSEAQRQIYARHVLRYAVPELAKLLDSQRAEVVDCRNWGVEVVWQSLFFRGYAAGLKDEAAGDEPVMFKLRDFPPEETFKERLGRHNQVRNLRSCTKVAIDFVSPESLATCFRLKKERRSLAKGEMDKDGMGSDPWDLDFHDKLQGELMLYQTVCAAVQTLGG